MQTQTTADLETSETEHDQTWYLPVTPADLGRFGIELDAPFGIDADEAAGLAEAEGVVRLAFGVGCDGADCERAIDVEAYHVDGSSIVAAIASNTAPAPRWMRCGRRYSMTAGFAQRLAYARNEARMWDLAHSRVADLDEALDARRGKQLIVVDLL